MAKIKISSPPGVVGLLFLIAGIVGVVLQFVDHYLVSFQSSVYGEPYDLIFFILSIAAMAFMGILLLVSLAGCPKALWIVFVFLGLACILFAPIFISVQIGTFYYVENVWYQLLPMDFIGFWLAGGGALVALIFGFIMPTEE